MTEDVQELRRVIDALERENALLREELSQTTATQKSGCCKTSPDLSITHGHIIENLPRGIDTKLPSP